MSRRTKNRNIIIIGLSSIVLLMAIGYAAFQTVLKIEGTSNISSTWDVQITGITKDKTKGNVTEISEPTFDKESASFKVGLESPGDYIYYKVAVTNKGSLAAIAKLGSLTCGTSNALQCGAYADSNVGNIGTNTDLTERRLIIGPNETEYYNVWIKYNDDITVQPNITNINIKLTLTYEQSDVGITHTTEDKCYTGKVLENGTLTITDYDEKCGTDVVIPETIDGYTVTEIQDGKWDDNLSKIVSPLSNKNITSAILPDSLMVVGRFAFANNKITNLKLSDSLRQINEGAFQSNRITNLELPATVESIDNCAFWNNTLNSLNIPNTVKYLGGGVFSKNKIEGESAYIYGRNSDGSIDYKVLDSYGGSSAADLQLPSSVEIIKIYAFRQVNLTSLEIPSNVKKIDTAAFAYAGIQNLTLNEGLMSIGYRAFLGNKLNMLNIPSTVTSIGENAFESGGTYNPITSITINKKEGSITGSPWGATKAQINWTGTN